MGRAGALVVTWAVFLDRDGVLNRSLVRDGRPYAPTTLAEFEWLSGVDEALQQLKNAGAKLVVVTNQPDVGNGFVTQDTVEAMHRRVRAELPVDDIRVCYHTAEENCSCRKPLPGMLREAADDHDIELEQSVMIGDRWRDIDAGAAAGCRTIFIDYGYKEARRVEPDYIVASISEAAQIVIRNFPWKADAQ